MAETSQQSSHHTASKRALPLHSQELVSTDASRLSIIKRGGKSTPFANTIPDY